MDEDIIETKVEKINEALYINRVFKNYKLTIALNSEDITLNISEINKFMQSYEIKLNLEQIKEKHDTFSHINSLQEFFDIIKNNIEKNGILINKPSENLIHFEFKKNSIIFELTKVKINNLSKLLENINISHDKYNMKISSLENKLVNIYNENRYMKNEIDELKKANDILVNAIKKLKEKINNIMESNNNKIQYLKERFIEKEKMKKDEEIKRSEEISKLKSQKDNLRLESLEKNINRFIINKDEKERQKNYVNNLNTNINNIYINEKENSEIKNIIKGQENSKDNVSELNQKSNLRQKYKLLKLKNKDKYYNNNKTNIPITPEKNLNKIPHKTNIDYFDINLKEFNDKNKKKNIFPPINIAKSKEKQNQMMNTQKYFYIKKENLIDKEEQGNRNEIKRHTYSENKILPKEDNKIYKKQVLLSKKNLFDDIKKKTNDKRFSLKKIKLKMDEGDEIKNFPRITIFEKNFDNKNEEEANNSLTHFSRTVTNSKKKDFDFCYLS